MGCTDATALGIIGGHQRVETALGIHATVRDRLRTLLHIRRPRTLPVRGPRPNAGSRIYCGDLRMTVQAGMTAELWHWLQATGWREVVRKPDRRRYIDIPSEAVAELIACDPVDRAHVLEEAIAGLTRR
jgi:hypothetical protein